MNRLIYLPETSSTNSYLKNLLKQQDELPNKTLVSAGFQTMGRGQQGNFWESEKDKNLIFSLLYYPLPQYSTFPFLLVELTSLCVLSFLNLYISDVTIKWPNDIYWKDSKICGILIENQFVGGNFHAAIIGIGLNVNQDAFVSDAPNPVSLKQITGLDYDLKELLASFIQQFNQLQDEFNNQGIEWLHQYYQSELYRREGTHCFSDDNGEFQAKIKEVEKEGYLLLQLNDQSVRRYAFKEVSFVHQ